MKSFPLWVVILLAMGALTTVVHGDVSFTINPWTAQVDSVTSNSCCFGNTSGLTPEVSGISSNGNTTYLSRMNLKNDAGVDCGNLDNNSCITCFMNATLANDGFVLKCALTEDHHHEVSFDSVQLNVVVSSETTHWQDLTPSTTQSSAYSIHLCVVLPVVYVLRSLAVLFIS